MTTQSEALQLADALEMDKWHISGVTAQSAAEELRRLHAENEDLRRCAEVEEVEKYAAANRRLHALNGELLEALKQAANHAYWPDIEKQIRAAIARAEGKV